MWRYAILVDSAGAESYVRVKSAGYVVREIEFLNKLYRVTQKLSHGGYRVYQEVVQ